MKRSLLRALAMAASASVVAAAISVALIEVWVRATWDERRGTPGFYVSDPILGQRLTPGYHGWFAGAPVHINALGFRDPRDYALKKPPGTFRILVLGDSVTFGHGDGDEATYPRLLERELDAWRSDVNWEVWNLGVPGYNTSQELAYLQEVGPRYDPDLVIVGFYENDLADNQPPGVPSLAARVKSAIQRTAQRYFYSYELYRRVALTIRFRLTTSTQDRQRLAELDGEGRLLRPADGPGAPAPSRLEQLDYFDDQQIHDFVCDDVKSNHSTGDSLVKRLRTPSPDLDIWRAAVRTLQQMNRDGRGPVMFFINMAPRECPGEDRYVDGGALEDDDTLREVLGDGAPVASSTRAFLHYRPSQTPGAGGHSLAGANLVKARVLFEFLRDEILPPLVRPARP